MVDRKSFLSLIESAGSDMLIPNESDFKHRHRHGMSVPFFSNICFLGCF